MKSIVFSLILFASLLLLSCAGAKPESCFIVLNKDGLGANDTMSFRNCSLNASSYSWDFGDGTTTEAFIPEHAYGAAGDYTITLTVSDDGRSDTSTEIISVGP